MLSSLEETWQEVAVKEDAGMLARDVEEFLESARRVARFIASQTGAFSGREVMMFVSRGGLERDADAATVARAEYSRFLLSRPILRADLIVGTMQEYYTALAKVFAQKGIEWTEKA
jgi:hypothetical protein